MIEAVVFVHGHESGHVNWSSWRFLQLPASGDLISLQIGNLVHSVKVRHVEHMPTRVDVDGQPTVIIVSDWQEMLDDEPS